jgi:hypothetical protein
MYKVVGTCSICSGDVVLYDNWMSTNPQKRTCRTCGAQEKSQSNVIPMEHPTKKLLGEVLDDTHYFTPK